MNNMIRIIIITSVFSINCFTQTFLALQHGLNNSLNDFILIIHKNEVNFSPAVRFSSNFEILRENEIIVMADQFLKYTLDTNEYTPFYKVPEKYNVISFSLSCGKLYLCLSEDEFYRFTNDNLFIWDGNKLIETDFPEELNMNHISVNPTCKKIAFQHSIIAGNKIKHFLMIYDFIDKSVSKIDSNFSGDNYCYSYDNNPFIQWISENKLLFIEYTDDNPMGIIFSYNCVNHQKEKFFESTDKKIFSFQYMNGNIYALTISNEIVKIGCKDTEILYTSIHYPLRCFKIVN